MQQIATVLMYVQHKDSGSHCRPTFQNKVGTYTTLLPTILTILIN